MNSRIIKRIVGIMLMIGILLTLLVSTAHVLERTDSKKKYYEFYKYADEFDILHLGSSHIWNGIIPMELWHDYGITSYNLGFSGCRLGMSYWVLENALQYSNPSMVVLDCAYLKNEKASPSKEYNHYVLDEMNHFPTKVKAVFDLFDSTEDHMRYLFPFSVYHNRWSEFFQEEFSTVQDSFQLGYASEHSVISAKIPSIQSEIIERVSNISVDYLRRIIELCKKENIEIILTFLPFNCNSVSLNDAAFVQQIADEYGVRYLGMEFIMDVLNSETDFANNYDDNSHLNNSGAQKVTKLLGKIITEEYEIPDHRNNEQFAHWNDMYSQYHNNIQYTLGQIGALDQYLVALHNRDYHVIIQLGSPVMSLNSKLSALLENIGVPYDTPIIDAEYIVANDHNNTHTFYSALEDIPYELAVAAQLHADESISLIEDDEIRLWILDGKSKQLINSVKFSVNELVSPDVLEMLIQHGQRVPQYAADLASCQQQDMLYVLPNGNLYGYTTRSEEFPAFTIEQISKSCWYADSWNPLGCESKNEEISAKRTSLIPVTPGDQFSYKGRGKYVSESVVWLDANQMYLSAEQYDARKKSVILTVPENAAYAWFASFGYGDIDSVIFDVRWIKCQAISAALEWSEIGYTY